MTKFTISKQIFFFRESVIYHVFKVRDPEFKPYLYSTSYLKNLKLCILQLIKKMIVIYVCIC